MSYTISLPAREIERRLFKSADEVYSATYTEADSLISVHAADTHLIEDGSELKFRAPAGITNASMLQVHYYDLANDKTVQIVKNFRFVDAAGNELSEATNLFISDNIISVILDSSTGDTGLALIQGTTLIGLGEQLDELLTKSTELNGQFGALEAQVVAHINDKTNPHEVNCSASGTVTEEFVQDKVDSLISCGTSDPDATIMSQFYFKYNTK